MSMNFNAFRDGGVGKMGGRCLCCDVLAFALYRVKLASRFTLLSSLFFKVGYCDEVPVVFLSETFCFPSK